MSTQSIEKITLRSVSEKIDDFLICQGRLFSNIIDYDLGEKFDYKKLNMILTLNKLSNKCDNLDKILPIIDKLIKK